MLNLHAAALFLSRLPIKDRDSSRMVPFLLNPNQQIVMAKLQKRIEASHPLPLWMICCKARRVGFSSLADGLITLNQAEKPNGKGLIVAHLSSTSEALFSVPKNLYKAFPFIQPDPLSTVLKFPHPEGDSQLSIATAGTVVGGRGMTLSDLHLSEAAYFPGVGAFTSLISAVSRTPENMVAVESTANGKTGTGQAFFDLWNDAVREANEFLAIFLSWTDDPTCRRSAEEVIADCPIDEDEKDLIALLGCPDFCGRCAQCHKALECAAWRRWAINNLCQGYAETFRQEYPTTAEEAFIVSSNPAFAREELRQARKDIREPIAEGRLELANSNEPPPSTSAPELDTVELNEVESVG